MGRWPGGMYSIGRNGISSILLHPALMVARTVAKHKRTNEHTQAAVPSRDNHINRSRFGSLPFSPDIDVCSIHPRRVGQVQQSASCRARWCRCVSPAQLMEDLPQHLDSDQDQAATRQAHMVVVPSVSDIVVLWRLSLAIHGDG
jgi:hypothetical protein